MLLQMPAADGLYHKVISQSGALKRSRTKSVEEEKIYWQELGSKTAQILGLDETSIDRVRKIPYEELSAAASQAGRELGREGGMMLLNPSPVDDYYIGSFELAGFREETADIPVIAGTVLGEFNFMHYLGDKNRYSEEEKMALLRETFGDKAERVRKLFEEQYPGKDPLYALSVDFLFRPATVAFLDERTKFLKKLGKETRSWNYVLSVVLPYLGGITLFHCGDIPFTFRNTELEPLICTAADYREELEDRMSEAWLAFMKNGDPSTKELPWEPYTVEHKTRMQFDGQSRMNRTDDTELLVCF